MERKDREKHDFRKFSLTDLNYNSDGDPAPAAPVFRDFHFSHIDLSKADPKKPVIIVGGFAQEGHRTRHLTFDTIRLPAQARIKVDQAEDVGFSNFATTDGSPPEWKVTNSERITGAGK